MCCCENGLIYAVSTMSVWRLKPVRLGVQIEGLLEEKHFQLALKLAVSYMRNIVRVFVYDSLFGRTIGKAS